MAEYSRDFQDLNGEWRLRFQSQEEKRMISRGYRPCLRCGEKLVMSVTGICVPCRKSPCKGCGYHFTPTKKNDTPFCTKCRDKRRRREQGAALR